jgi:hypothetical protein
LEHLGAVKEKKVVHAKHAVRTPVATQLVLRCAMDRRRHLTSATNGVTFGDPNRMLKRWPVLLGIALPVLATVIFIIVTRNQQTTLATATLSVADQAVADGARKRGIDPKGAVEGVDLIRRAEKAGDLSDADWAATKKLLEHPQPTVAAEALSVMMHLRNSNKRDEAIEIARKERKSSDSHTRRTALILLYHLEAPDWRSEVEAARNSTDPDERGVATAILQRDSGSPPLPMK